VDLNFGIILLALLLAGTAGSVLTFFLLSKDRNDKRTLRVKCDHLDQLASLISNAALIAEYCLHANSLDSLDRHLDTLADDLKRLGRYSTKLQLLGEVEAASAGFKYQAILCRLYNFRLRSKASLSSHLVAKFDRVIQLRKVWALGLLSDRYQQTRREL